MLALYRNIKGWPDKTGAVKDYYKQWTPAKLAKFDLNAVSLPVVLCVFPTLDESNPSQFKVTQACRSVFLALNKNAQPVSTSRNILLDDYDIIAHFERNILEKVKEQDEHSQASMRLWNFELDSEENKIALNSTVAYSGVMHLYQMLERLLLLSDAPNGLNVSSPRYKSIKKADDALKRLDGFNLLGEEVAGSTSRYFFTSEALDLLLKSFEKRYTSLIVKGFQSFAPYEAMGKAAIELKLKLQQKHELQCHAMLFEGQGILGVFLSFLEQFNSDLKEKHPAATPQSNWQFSMNLRVHELDCRNFQEEFNVLRAYALLDKISKAKVVPVLQAALRDIYKTDLTTTAFQIALFATFYFAVEALNKKGQGITLKGDENESKLFEEYMNSLNPFFKPTSDADVKRLLNVFVGTVSRGFWDHRYEGRAE